MRSILDKDEILKNVPDQDQIMYFEAPAEDLSAYVVEPQKSGMSKKEIKQTIIETLRNCYFKNPIDIEQFKKAIACAKGRKMDLTKIKVPYYMQYDFDSEIVKYNPIRYATFNFFVNEKEFSEIIRYLVANAQGEKAKEEIQSSLWNMFTEWRGEDKHYVYKGANLMSPEMMQTFKLLKDNGASIKEFSSTLFYYNSNLFQNKQFIEMLLQLDEPDINRALSQVFYWIENYEDFFEIINRYDINPFTVEQAIHQLDGTSKNMDRIGFLIDQGKLDIKDFTQETLKKTMEGMYFYVPFEEENLEKRYNNIIQEHSQIEKGDKKYSTKKSLSIQDTIDQIYEDAMENIN